MTLKGKAKEVAAAMLAAFEAGEVPKALASIFIHRGLDCPTSNWSWRNQFLVALRGHCDARGYRQWQQTGRNVRKGQRACHILAPRTRRATEDDPARNIKEGDSILTGYLAVAVFGYDQTEGEPLPGMEDEKPFLAGLPLIDVAKHWGLQVSTVDADLMGFLGRYRHGQSITLAVKDLSTWTHELTHAAEDRLGTLNKAPGQQLDNEVVAEFGGAVLLECLGFTTESDRGGAFRYIEGYAKKHKRSAVSVCTELIDRTCAAVEHILKTADQLGLIDDEQAAA